LSGNEAVFLSSEHSSTTSISSSSTRAMTRPSPRCCRPGTPCRSWISGCHRRGSTPRPDWDYVLILYKWSKVRMLRCVDVISRAPFSKL